MRGELGYTLGLLGVDHEAALNIAQRTATDILIDGQMQHAVNQAFTERTAREGHTLNIQFAEDGDKYGQPAGENQRSF